jgi:beta-phosphoglucomutase-like phosphatase (HAD superfamily)
MIKNILFDFDGTLFDTQKLHSAVESELLQKHGIQISSEEITKKYSGVRTNEFFAELLGDKQLADELVRQKWEVLFKRSHLVEELADLSSLFLALKAKDILFGIGTASPKRWVDEILKNNSLEYFFDQDSVVGGDMVEKGKPDKETWARLQRGIPPEQCLVVEDGVSGCLAAISAGMPFVVLGEEDGRFPNGSIFVKSLGDGFLFALNHV